jgi:micrococcal nuclease
MKKFNIKNLKLKRQEKNVIYITIVVIIIVFFAKGEFKEFIKNEFKNSNSSDVQINEESNNTSDNVTNTQNNSNQNTNNTIEDTSPNVSKENFVEVKVKRIVDGDTIVVTLNNKDEKVRLIGINTPESTTKIETFGKEASNYTKDKLTNKTVYLEKDISQTDKYGRLLRYVWLEIPNEITEDEIKKKMFNAILVLEGYAQVATYPPDVKYVDYFKNIQSIARDSNLGLWKYK